MCYLFTQVSQSHSISAGAHSVNIINLSSSSKGASVSRVCLNCKRIGLSQRSCANSGFQSQSRKSLLKSSHSGFGSNRSFQAFSLSWENVVSAVSIFIFFLSCVLCSGLFPCFDYLYLLSFSTCQIYFLFFFYFSLACLASLACQARLYPWLKSKDLVRSPSSLDLCTVLPSSLPLLVTRYKKAGVLPPAFALILFTLSGF